MGVKFEDVKVGAEFMIIGGTYGGLSKGTRAKVTGIDDYKSIHLKDSSDKVGGYSYIHHLKDLEYVDKGKEDGSVMFWDSPGTVPPGLGNPKGNTGLGYGSLGRTGRQIGKSFPPGLYVPGKAVLSGTMKLGSGTITLGPVRKTVVFDEYADVSAEIREKPSLDQGMEDAFNNLWNK